MRGSGERTKVGRYALDELIGSGGMARVYVGRLEGWAGFSTRVAIKRLHPDLAADPEFSSMLLDEARLTGHIRHPNVVGTIDVVREQSEFLLVMEYVVGVPLDVLLKRSRAARAPIPLDVVAAIVTGVLGGLHAAHEATDGSGAPLHIVHRDVSPQNILVEESGLAKLLDFGVATAANRLTTTKEGTIKGKPAYIAPEQLTRTAVDRRADVFAVGVVLWEMLTNTRLREDASFARVISDAERGCATPLPLEEVSPGAARRLAAVAAKAVAFAREDRYLTASAMAHAIEEIVAPATLSQVSAWCAATAPEVLEGRRAIVASQPDRPGHEEEATALAAVTRSAPSANSRRRVLAIGVLFTIIAVGLGAVWTRERDVASMREREAASTREREDDARASGPRVVAEATAPVTASSAKVAGTLSVARAASAPPTSLAPVGTTTKNRKRAPHPASKAARDACRVPFVVDDAGLKIPKRECL